MKRTSRAYTLVEIVVAMAIVGVVISLMIQLPLGWRRDVMHLNYGHTIEARLLAASAAAKLTGFHYSVEPKVDGRGLLWTVEQPGGNRLWFSLDFESPFALQLPEATLPHPTMSGDLEQAWPRHVSRWRIKANGQTGGYFVVSDGKRTMCHLIAGSGQIRTFRWDRKRHEWMVLL